MHMFSSLVVSRRDRVVKALDLKYIEVYSHRFESCQRLQIFFGTGDLFLILSLLWMLYL